MLDSISRLRLKTRARPGLPRLAQDIQTIGRPRRSDAPLESLVRDPALETLALKYLSDAYFDALDSLPELGQYFALGERVKARVGDVVVEVLPEEGEEELAEDWAELLADLAEE